MRVCYFGTYSMEEGYPRNKVIIEGLRRNGVDVVECHEDFWRSTEEKLEGVKAVSISVMLKNICRLLRAYRSLFYKFRKVGSYDVMIVGYAGHIDIFFAKVLNLFRRRPVLLDAFLSLYDTAVIDRRIVSPGSMKAKLLYLMDRWSCRIADVVLLDTQAHVDYFVREFRLPSRKFFAVPVGSSMEAHENPPIPQVHLNPPLLKGEIGGFTVLYFGSYIPLHGVDVILKAAKIVQENKNRFSDETLMSPDSQRSMKIEGGVVARAEGPKQSLNGAGFGIASHPPDARNDNAEGFSDEKGIVFTLVGTGQLLSEMKELASRLELKNVIFIDRFVSEEELVGYIQQADICLGVFGQTDKAARVIPCKVYNCLAMGKPLVTAGTQATEGVLTHRESAFLCKPGDPAALSEAILSLKKDPMLRERIAHNGQEYFKKNFSVEAIGRKVMVVIEHAI